MEGVPTLTRFLARTQQGVLPRAAESSDRPGADGKASGPPIRVTHIVFDWDGGGMEGLVAAMAQRLAGTSVRMSVITLSGREGRVGAATRRYLDRYEVIRPIPGVSMLFPLALMRALRVTRPDVVHLHSGSWYKSSLAAKWAGVRRVIYTEHGREHDDPPAARWLDRRAAERTDVVVAVSNRLCKYLGTVLDIDPSQLCTIDNGVDTVRFSPGAPPPGLRKSLDIPADAHVVGSIGRLEPVKAYDRLIDAVGQLRATGKLDRPVVLVICGGGSQRTALETRVQQLGLRDAVRLPGWSDEPTAMYRLFDVFALTSLSEGASVSLLESMACGIPPVVMDVGSNASIVGPELKDQVVPSGGISAFVHVLGETCGLPARSRRAGTLVRRRVVEHYGLEKMIAAYERLYRGWPPTSMREQEAS